MRVNESIGCRHCVSFVIISLNFYTVKLFLAFTNIFLPCHVEVFNKPGGVYFLPNGVFGKKNKAFGGKNHT